MAFENLPKGFYVEDGIDVDFAAAKAAGFKFCIARAADCDQLTDGNPYDEGNYVDMKFADHVGKAYENGLILIAMYRLGVVPNVHAVDWKTPGAGPQIKALKHALKNKTYHAIAVTLPTKDNTDTNMNEMLKQFINVMQHKDVGLASKPIIVGTTPDVWQYGSKSIENTIGQPDYPHVVWNMSSREFSSPGNLPTSNRMMWTFGYDIGTAVVRWIGSEAGLLEKFGTPDNYDYIPDGGSTGGDTDPPDDDDQNGDSGTGGEVIPSADLVAAVDRLNATLREAFRL